jgi:hypothetical protein
MDYAASLQEVFPYPMQETGSLSRTRRRFLSSSLALIASLHRLFNAFRKLTDSLDVILANLPGHMTKMHVGNVLLEFHDDLREVAAMTGHIEAFPLSVLL